MIRIWQIGALAFLVLAIWGATRFPLAPITAFGAEFRDKLGNQHAADEYHAYVRWARVRDLGGGTFAIFSIALAVTHYHRNRGAAGKNQEPNQ